jgi:hypothetical protein
MATVPDYPSTATDNDTFGPYFCNTGINTGISKQDLPMQSSIVENDTMVGSDRTAYDLFRLDGYSQTSVVQSYSPLDK